MKILLLGKNGQVGWELQRALAPLATLVALDRRGEGGLAADLSRPESLADTVRALEPDVIVTPPPTPQWTRRRASLARPCDQRRSTRGTGPRGGTPRALLVHYSTDYVFDGSGDAPRAEDAPTAPLSGTGRPSSRARKPSAQAAAAI